MNNINRQESNEIPQKEYPTEKIKINSNYKKKRYLNIINY